MLQIRQLSKEFTQGGTTVQVLAGVDLSIEAGEFVAIVGPSGSGKSTMLNIIGGLDDASGGDVAIDGRSVSAMGDDERTLFRRRHLGFIFQFFNLLPTLTAEENVAFPLLLDGASMRSVRARVGEMLGRVGLAHRAQHTPDHLSGGEMQRVAIARALVIQPTLVLADEPTGNLDSASGEQILGLLREANRSMSQTIVMVTHDPRAAATADRVVEFKDGRIDRDTPTAGAPRVLSSTTRPGGAG